jgi:hypothetical protein
LPSQYKTVYSQYILHRKFSRTGYGWCGKIVAPALSERRSMKKVKFLISTIFSSLILFAIQVPCHAAETAFKEIVQDSLYGGLAGTVVGAAVLAFTHKPGDHLEYMAYGAAAGVLGGAAYGYFSSRKSEVIFTTELIKGNF